MIQNAIAMNKSNGRFNFLTLDFEIGLITKLGYLILTRKLDF